MKVDVSLYLVTDSSVLPAGKTLADSVREAIHGGASIVQLREKKLIARDFLATARIINSVCKEENVPFIINDRIDIALACGADGVHIGQEDIPLADARRLLGPNKIIGVTTKSVDQALAAVEGGADYIAPGVVFPTTTKDNAIFLGPAGVAKVVAAVRAINTKIPIVTIGGINSGNVVQMLHDVERESGGFKLSGVAVVSAIMKHSNAKEVASELKEKLANQLYAHTEKDELVERLISLLEKVRTKKPFVHSITNNIVQEMTANIILHLGGAPIMAHSIDEVREVGQHIDALILNMGTLDTLRIASFHEAAKAANEINTPIVLDPVGCGFTSLRRKAVSELLETSKFAVIKGNAGEIGYLYGSLEASSRGADSVGSCQKIQHGRLYHGYVSDGNVVVCCENGNSQLGLLTGTGCSTTALIGCFAGVAEGDYLFAAVAGCVAMGVAAEMAVNLKTDGGGSVVLGPASFRTALFDSIYHLDAITLREYAKAFLIQ
ncbi:thiamine monophosphate synthase/TENI-domain-containing protein [Obelidium mucronatum]|nr:thiamine monophosphate synthase/TENI-domain-containing protein [Obelidium mucronatum]